MISNHIDTYFSGQPAFILQSSAQVRQPNDDGSATRVKRTGKPELYTGYSRALLALFSQQQWTGELYNRTSTN